LSALLSEVKAAIRVTQSRGTRVICVSLMFQSTWDFKIADLLSCDVLCEENHFLSDGKHTPSPL